MRYAEIINGSVVNIIDAEPAFVQEHGTSKRKFIEDPDGLAFIGGGYAKGKFVMPVDENPEPAPRQLVPKRVIIDRLHEAGKLEAAYAALEAADLYTRERWNTRMEIYADDPTAIALLQSIGANVEAILA